MLEKTVALPASLAQDCRLLTPFAVAARYPIRGGEPSESEARRAIAAMERIHKFITPFLH
jgi:HEPN domain-containing protein